MTKTTAADNGNTTTIPLDVVAKPDTPDHGLIVLRDKEARGLIGLACDALSETREVTHDLHQAIYGYGEPADGDSRDRFQVLNEALGCLRTTEHYLLMLSSVFQEQDHGEPGLCPADPAF
jgi:hypothetical protein